MGTANHWMRQVGAQLIDNGYSIVPIMPGTKKPGRWAGGAWVDFVGWRAFSSTPPSPYHVDTWEKWPDCGVGVLCGTVCPVDIDVLDHEVANQVADIIQAHLGETSVVRIGKAPKMLLLYRTETPFSKIQMHPIECLADGQQFVAYAIHPDTGRAYDWPLDGLADTPIDRLPVVTEAQMRAAMEAAFAIIPEHLKPRRPLSVASDVATPHMSGDLEGTPEGIAECMARIPNEDVSWDDWNKVGMALYAASNGRAFALFDTFSMRSAKYDPKETLKRWNSYARSRPRSIGMGTLVHLAQQFGDTPIPDDVPFNESKREAADFDISGLLEGALDGGRLQDTEFPKQSRADPASGRGSDFPNEWLETPSLVGQIVRWIVETSTFPQPALAVANTLTAMGAIFGRTHATSSEYLSPTRCNVYAVGIAATASGKEHSRRCIEKIFQESGLHSKFMGGENFSSETAIVNLLHGHPSRLCQVDELGEIMKSALHKNAMGPKSSIVLGLLKCFSASTYRGQEFADPRARPRVDIYEPNLNIYATTTPQNLMSCLTRAEVENGLLNRMLFFVSDERRAPIKLRKIDRKLPVDLINQLQHAMNLRPEGAGNLLEVGQMAELTPELMPVFFDEGVEGLVVDLLNEQGRILDEGRYMWGRYGEHTLKLAMIEAIARVPEQPIITKDVFEMSRRLAFWCLDRAEALVADNVAENTVERDKKAILRIIKEGGSDGVSLTAITRGTQSIIGDMRKKLLLDLQEAGQIRAVERPSTGGRKPVHYSYVQDC